MAAPDLYRKLLSKPESVTWLDFFTDFYKKHTREDRERLINIKTHQKKDTRLKEWQKPWFFFQILVYGLGIIGIFYILLYLLIESSGSIRIPAINIFVISALPLLFPIVLMVFFWELNIPGNIDLLKLGGIFLSGGLLSLIISIFLFENVKMSSDAAYAAFIEEPGKLIASVIVLTALSRNPKFRVCGLTGLVVGAAVGAGFGGFESIQYGLKVNGYVRTEFLGCIDKDILMYLLKNQFSRGIWAVAGHTLYCAPYAAAAALHTKEGRINPESFLNKDFAIAFAVSVCCHFIWNSISIVPVFVVLTLVLWVSSLSIVKKCLIQYLESKDEGNSEHSSLETYLLRASAGVYKGKVYPLSNEVRLGRNEECEICLPENTPGISRLHCQIVCSGGKLFITDLGSTYGTYVNRQRISVGTYHPLSPGDKIQLGSESTAFIVCKKQ